MTLKLPETLRALMKRYQINELQLARKTGVRQPVINRILSGKTPNPQIATLIPLANHFKVSIECLAGLNESTASERAHLLVPPNKDSFNVPLVPTNMLWDYCHRSEQQTHAIEIANTLSVAFNPGPLGFAFSVFDKSMAPAFPKHTVIVIDPTLKIVEGDFVLVSCKKTKKLTFKQYVMDGTQNYLKSINPDFPMTPIKNNHTVVGIMIQALIKRQKHNST